MMMYTILYCAHDHNTDSNRMSISTETSGLPKMIKEAKLAEPTTLLRAHAGPNTVTPQTTTSPSIVPCLAGARLGADPRHSEVRQAQSDGHDEEICSAQVNAQMMKLNRHNVKMPAKHHLTKHSYSQQMMPSLDSLQCTIDFERSVVYPGVTNRRSSSGGSVLASSILAQCEINHYPITLTALRERAARVKDTTSQNTRSRSTACMWCAMQHCR